MDETKVGGRNILRNSGNFKHVNYWQAVNGGVLSVSIVDQAQCLYMQSTGHGAAINQSMTYSLDFDMTYVYQAVYMLNHAVDTGLQNPLNMSAQITPYVNGASTINAIESMEWLGDDRTDRGVWEHAIIRFKTVARPSEDASIVFRPWLNNTATDDTSNTDDGRAALWLKWIMLEKGNTPSDWSPAPEDIQEEMDQTQQEVDALIKRVEKAELKITDNAIVGTVLSSEEYTSRIETLEGSIALTKQDFNVQFSEVNERIADASSDTANLRNEITSWLNFSSNAVLEIGRSNSDFKMNLSNTELAFLYKNSKMAYFGTDNGLYINKATIKDSLTIGNITMISDSAGRMIWV